MKGSANAATSDTTAQQSLIPRIVARDSAGLVDFLRKVFDASGDYAADRPSQMTIGNCSIMVSEAGERDRFPAFLYVYVDDADAVCRRAIECGALSLEPVWDTPYGDRRGMVRDRWDNVWQIATLPPKTVTR